MDVIEVVMKWVIAPVAAFVMLMYRVQQNQTTDIAVLKATMAANKEAHDREFKEMRASFVKVIGQLDSIEQHLRK
jgi:soluble cytochrome b562